MKRKVLCIFSLIAYLLLFCTCLAPMVEREMAVLADIKEIKAKTSINSTLPGYSAQWGEIEGLFQIVEGTGWSSGSRVAEIPLQYYRNYGGHIVLHPGTPYSLIISASRTPREGDRVTPVEAKESPGEKLIIYCPEGIGEMKPLQNNFTVLQQEEKGIFLDTMSIKMPFFEHRMMEALKDRITAEGMRIYSYTDAQTFFRQLPLLAVVGALLLMGVILWGGACYFTKDANRPAPIVCVSGVAMVFVLLLSKWAAGGIDLPASLMPPENFFDVGHYVAEISNIFTAVDDSALRGGLIGNAVVSAFILLAGIALGIAILWTGRKYLQKKAAEIGS